MPKHGQILREKVSVSDPLADFLQQCVDRDGQPIDPDDFKDVPPAFRYQQTRTLMVWCEKCQWAVPVSGLALMTFQIHPQCPKCGADFPKESE